MVLLLNIPTGTAFLETPMFYKDVEKDTIISQMGGWIRSMLQGERWGQQGTPGRCWAGQPDSSENGTAEMPRDMIHVRQLLQLFFTYLCVTWFDVSARKIMLSFWAQFY